MVGSEWVVACHSYPFPSFWPPQSTSFAAVPLDEESPEWRGVFDSLCQSMRDAEVVGITRVQNRHLWEQHRHVELHTGSLGFEATPNRMWCSTHLTPPLEVVSSVDGLRPWTAVRGSSVYLQCAIQAPHQFHVPAHLSFCVCVCSHRPVGGPDVGRISQRKPSTFTGAPTSSLAPTACGSWSCAAWSPIATTSPAGPSPDAIGLVRWCV